MESWNNDLEDRPKLTNYEVDDGYQTAAHRLSNKLYELLTPPYTSVESSSGGETAADVMMTAKHLGTIPYDLITVSFLTQPRESKGAPYLRVEMRNILRTYDRIDEVLFHHIDGRYLMVGASYNETKGFVNQDGPGVFPMQKTRYQTEFSEEDVLDLEDLIDSCSPVPSR